jgi:DNA mismatch endonuclease, patch repair protein
MSKICSKYTKVESVVFKELRNKGVYFQSHYAKVFGSPDIALPRKKIAIFIDGDFWHGYKYQKLKKRLPKQYWVPKIERNIKRDSKNRRMLRRNGWAVLRVWEHEVYNDREKCIAKIIDFISTKKSGRELEIRERTKSRERKSLTSS